MLYTSDRLCPSVHAVLAKLFECYFAEPRSGPGREAGCKAYLLEALYRLDRHFGLADHPAPAFDGRRRQSLQFGRSYE
jgi:hypothetical protein